MPPLTQDEHELRKRLVESMTFREAAAEYERITGRAIREGTLRQWAYTKGVAGNLVYRPWTMRELGIVRELYPHRSVFYVRARLRKEGYDRPVQSIYTIASKFGITKDRRGKC